MWASTTPNSSGGLIKGRIYCLAAGRPYAHIWRKIWDKIDDIGCVVGPHGQLRPHKVKAHLPEQTILDMTGLDRLLHLANGHADGRAKAAAKEGWPQLDWQVTAYREAHEPTRTVARYIGSFRALIADRATTTTMPPAQGQQRRVAPRRAKGPPRAKATVAQRVVRPPAQEGGQANGGHGLARLEDFTFCFRCGAFGRVMARNLARVCPREPRHTQAKTILKRLLAGCHPLQGHYLGQPLALHAVARAEGRPEDASLAAGADLGADVPLPALAAAAGP